MFKVLHNEKITELEESEILTTILPWESKQLEFDCNLYKNRTKT